LLDKKLKKKLGKILGKKFLGKMLLGKVLLGEPKRSQALLTGLPAARNQRRSCETRHRGQHWREGACLTGGRLVMAQHTDVTTPGNHPQKNYYNVN
jgi:hypothetical protein